MAFLDGQFFSVALGGVEVSQASVRSAGVRGRKFDGFELAISGTEVEPDARSDTQFLTNLSGQDDLSLPGYGRNHARRMMWSMNQGKGGFEAGALGGFQRYFCLTSSASSFSR
jgi:hypothetical protein